jgi:streptomycin 6-kinase
MISDLHPELRRAVAELGAPARRWLEDLPTLLDRTVEAWGLTLHGPLASQGDTSRVVAVTTAAGGEAVLKLLVPHDEARGEADALAAWDGDGAARLLDRSEDGFTLLLERCRPGDDLWSVPRDDRLDVVATLLPRLWAAPVPPSAPPLRDTALRWAREAPTGAAAHGQPSDVADDVRRWVDELTADATRPVLLHGDLHPGNVLDAGSRGWVAIDPKPWVGDPAFDLAQLLFNELDGAHTEDRGAVPADRDAVVGLRAWVDRLSHGVDVDPGRVLRWAVVKGTGWGVTPATADTLVRAARAHERDHR